MRRDLADHPNGAWVESLLWCAEHGFWPCHDGEPPVPPPTKEAKRARKRLFPEREEDQAVQEEKARAAVAKGQFSPAVDRLPLGALLSAQFILRRTPEAKPRLIDDHAASGLNGGIGHAPAVYDRVSDLVFLLRYLGYLDDDFPLYAVVWKLDVSDAFKLLLMHPAWQFRQGVAVAYLQPDGSRRVRYHLAWRAAFGSKASPYLWTSLMAGVHWAVQKRSTLAPVPRPLSPSSPSASPARLLRRRPLTYMDDSFGIDLSGETRDVEHDGETRAMPVEQAETVEVWDDWGVPWGWGKAESGRVIEICGIVVDLDAGTLTLAKEKVDLFALEVRSFLGSDDRLQPLRRWRQVTGWGNWALTVFPYGRPLLTPLYDKIAPHSGRLRSSPYTGVYTNKAVRSSLYELVRQLQHGEPLSMHDPGLSRWTYSDADVVVHCDACTDSDDGDSGLGYWFELDGRRHHYYSRLGRRYKSIQFLETLVVSHVVRSFSSLRSSRPSIRRLLVRTDSSPAVFAFDSGAARDTPDAPLHTLLRLSFGSLLAAKLDLRVHHIPGRLNRTADLLSRASPAHLSTTFAQRPPSQPKNPFPSLSVLRSERQRLWDAALEPGSRIAYQRAVNNWFIFCQAYALPSLPSAESLSLFVAWREGDAVAWAKARSSVEVDRALKGHAKLFPRAVRKAKPLPFPVLSSAVSLVSSSSSYDSLLWAAQAVVAFLTCARAQEVTTFDKVEFRHEAKFSLRSTARLSADGFSLFLPYMKNDPLYTGSKLWFARRDSGALLDVVRAYLKVRDILFGDGGFMWRRRDGTVPTRRWFVEELRRRCGAEYSGHSLRCGGATWYALRGVPDKAIKRLGRWRSDAWEDYIRVNDDLAIALRNRDAGEEPPPALLPSSFSSDALGVLLA
ncbi:hypothetical protein JCM10213_003703 [Rhodosporidiobolus nylandii]